MPKTFDNLLTILCAAVLLVGLVLYIRPESQPIDHAPARAVAIVHKAQNIMQDGAIAAAVKAFDRDGIYNRGGVYLFVLDADGQNIYHAADRTLTGTNFATLKDLDGRAYGQNLVRDATKSGIWYAHRARGGWRLTYARKTAHGYIVAAGFNAPY